MRRTPTKLSVEDLTAARAAGKTVTEIAVEYDCDVRTVTRKLARLKRRLVVPPLASAVPDGFEVSKISTRLDAEGNATGQNIQAKPIPDEDPDATDILPAGHTLKGVSTFVVDGEVKAQWIKTRVDDEQRAIAMKIAAEALGKSIMPLPEIPLADLGERNPNWLNLYTITDAHVGAMSWARETGEPWDLAIAERMFIETITRMIYNSPNAIAGVVNQLGDFLHYDSLVAETPTSRHALDADGRHQKMVEVGMRILEAIVHAALQKHEIVYLKLMEGNHDMSSSGWMRVMFKRLFRDNPRVVVEDSPNPYAAMAWGETMLGFHHGHLTKDANLPLAFATQYAAMWGSTKWRYIHKGHYHHKKEIEYSGCYVEQHPTLSAKDAYAARGAYHSMRMVQSRTYSLQGGEIGRQTFLPLE